MMNSRNDRSGNTRSSPGAEQLPSAAEYYNRALQHHQAGRLAEAEADYREALHVHSEHAEALHMLGVIAYQRGDFEEALSLMARTGKLIPANAGLFINMGNVLQALGRFDEAVAAFRNAIKLMPANAVAHNNLGNALRFQGEPEVAVASFREALNIDSGYTDAHVNLAMTYQAMGNNERAAALYEQAVRLDPGNRPAAHMLAALRGEVTDAAPQEHVERLFDEYSARFDHHLVETLGYSMPDELRGEVDRLLGPDAYFADAIDLGCGTGLAGVAFRDRCGRLVGIDLSTRMIDRARERGVYDELWVGGVVELLEADRGHYDFFICADVFPYIGKVQPLFDMIRSHARAGSFFAFSTELEIEMDFVLRPSGRYAHSQRYLKAVAAEYGFKVMTMRTENLRKHKGEWIPGDLIVLQYQG